MRKRESEIIYCVDFNAHDEPNERQVRNGWPLFFNLKAQIINKMKTKIRIVNKNKQKNRTKCYKKRLNE